MENSWSEIDSRLNEHGNWLLVGAIACVTIPPISGIICALALFIAAAGMHDRQARQSKSNILQDRLRNEFSGQDVQDSRALSEQMKIDKSRRDYGDLAIGYWFMIAVILFQGFKQYLICNGGKFDAFGHAITFPDWIIKGVFGSL
jgi:hypothetical protein